MVKIVEKNIPLIGMKYIVIQDYEMIETERLYYDKKYVPILKDEIAKILNN